MFSKANLVSCFLKNRSNIREDNRVRPRLLVVKRAQRIVHGSTTIPPLPTVFLRKFTTFSYRRIIRSKNDLLWNHCFLQRSKNQNYTVHSFSYCVLATLFLCTRDVQYRNSCTSLFFFFIFFLFHRVEHRRKEIYLYIFKDRISPSYTFVWLFFVTKKMRSARTYLDEQCLIYIYIYRYVYCNYIIEYEGFIIIDSAMFIRRTDDRTIRSVHI